MVQVVEIEDIHEDFTAACEVGINARNVNIFKGGYLFRYPKQI